MIAQMTSIDAVSFLKEFGLFAAFSVTIIYLLIKGLSWLALNIGIPLITKHFKFVDDLIVLLDKIQCSLGRLSDHQEVLAERQQAILDRLNDMDVERAAKKTRNQST